MISAWLYGRTRAVQMTTVLALLAALFLVLDIVWDDGNGCGIR